MIDWNGTDVAGFAALPPGRYRVELVPEEGPVTLTPEGEAAIEAARQGAREGRTVSWESVNAELKGIVAAARAR